MTHWVDWIIAGIGLIAAATAVGPGVAMLYSDDDDDDDPEGVEPVGIEPDSFNIRRDPGVNRP